MLYDLALDQIVVRNGLVEGKARGETTFFSNSGFLCLRTRTHSTGFAGQYCVVCTTVVY